MSTQEQKELKSKYYKEAIRYIDNATSLIKKAHKHGNYFDDVKYVRMASGTAYLGVLMAADGYLLSKGHDKKKLPKSIEMYRWHLSKLDAKLLRHLNVAYDIFHLAGYYSGNITNSIWKEGLEEAAFVIEKIRPAA